MAMRWRIPPTLSTAREPAHVQLQLTADELASVAGLPRAAIDRLVRAGLVEEIAPQSGRFSAAAAARLRRMQRLRADLGVNLVGAAIIVDLVERLERMTGSSKESQ
jgi:chaperone modulatory protein CbpM